MANSSLFEVYLRLRPATAGERFLDVEEAQQQFSDHITIKPPENDRRKRAVERFAFTRVFEEDAGQLDVFEGTGMLPLIDGVLGAEGREGRDGLLATLGVTGSGKSHTVLGSKYERGLTQMALDVLFSNIGELLVDPATSSSTFPSIAAADVSEAQMFPASLYLDTLYADNMSMASRAQTPSRAHTPGLVGSPSATPTHPTSFGLYPSLVQKFSRLLPEGLSSPIKSPPKSSLSTKTNITRVTRSTAAKIRPAKIKDGNSSFLGTTTKQRHHMPRLSNMPDHPTVDGLTFDVDQTAEYAIVVSMFEVYNDRIFDLLTGASQSSKLMNGGRRRALLFKPTEQSPDRKQVAGLKKIICGSLDEALMVLETGLLERKVTGTGSNSASSRSHGFFCVEVKKRHRATKGPWSSSTLTICDLAGSERARNAKTAGETLAEAGKINESLMYLGQCMQMQSDNGADSTNKRNMVPFRQCKLTELLFSNSFPSQNATHHRPNTPARSPQKAIMLVTADPLGDYNATSQILRYSALAREVTVPRAPSISHTIQLGPTPSSRPTTAQSNHTTTNGGRQTPSPAALEQISALEDQIATLSSQLEITNHHLTTERHRRLDAESAWRTASAALAETETALREELYAEYETRLEALQNRYRASWTEEAERVGEAWDRKVEILMTQQGAAVEVCEDRDDDNRVEELERENEGLRREVERLRRETQQRSPSKSTMMGRGGGGEMGTAAAVLTPRPPGVQQPLQLRPLRTPSRAVNAMPPPPPLATAGDEKAATARRQRVFGKAKKRWEVENDPFESD